MAVITKHAAYRIWSAYHEIEVGQKLLDDIDKTMRDGGDPTPYDPQNRHSRGYSLGVPHGSGERILNVHPKLAAKIIQQHIEEQHQTIKAVWAMAIGEI